MPPAIWGEKYANNNFYEKNANQMIDLKRKIREQETEIIFLKERIKVLQEAMKETENETLFVDIS